MKHRLQATFIPHAIGSHTASNLEHRDNHASMQGRHDHQAGSCTPETSVLGRQALRHSTQQSGSGALQSAINIRSIWQWKTTLRPRQSSGGRIRVCSSPPHGESTSGECYTVTTASTTQRSISPLSCLIHPGISRLELLFPLHNLRTDLFLVGECSSRPMCLKSLGYLLASCCDQVGSSKAAGYVPGYLSVSYHSPMTG